MPRPQAPVREFPAAAASAPRADQHSNLRSSPPPASIEEQHAAPAAPAELEPVAAPPAAQPEPAPKRVAAPARAPAAVAASRVEPPAADQADGASDTAVAPAPAVASRAAARPAARGAQRAPVDVPADEPPLQGEPVADVALLTANHHNGARSQPAADAIEPGVVVNEQNLEQYKHLLSPGLEWAVHYGWRIRVGAPRPIEMIRAYREATEKYSGQAKLSPDGLRVLNWTAGLPFPNIDVNDPMVAHKIMWNYSYSFVATDDYTAENFDADTGTIAKNKGMTVERHYMIDNLRKLNYTGRLFVDPKPNIPNSDDLRYKESLHPLSEPFDLKGVGGTFYRYNDPNRQDDSWLYLPQLRRVRRLSTAQRSDALFGQDSDIDSYYGYNGHIAWMDWKFLGERTILGAVHGQHVPVKWQEPEDWAFDDVWEPRQVYVIEGVSKLPQYAYGKRIIFIDKEGWVVTSSDIYDRAGQLWKVWVNLRSFKREVIPGAKLSRYSDEMGFTHAIVCLDTQLLHATKAALPSTHSQGEECLYYNMGDKVGLSEEFFSVAHLIEAGH
ncbi:MAG: DUF1329 domain-containing protein [Deltaproteobacteria bacterium]|nr:DUF1329 domain-containing protein [Deltaproteobacteria bacterium]